MLQIKGGYGLKIALVGSSGYIAKFILKGLEADKIVQSILKIDRNDNADIFLDLERPEKFDYCLLDDIDYIVFTAAISGPDQCAREFDECWKVNVIGTSFFIKEALIRKCKVLFFSSDAVYGNIPGLIYTEESKTEAYTPYGRMKKAIEDEFKNESLFKAIRLSYVASANDRFVSYCLTCLRDGVEAEIFHPFYRNVVVVSDVVNVVLFFVKHWEEYEPTFLNVAGKELVSRIRIADEINRLFDGRLKYYVSMPSDEFFNNRPAITQMKSIYAQQYKIIQDDSFTEKLFRELESIIQ